MNIVRQRGGEQQIEYHNKNELNRGNWMVETPSSQNDKGGIHTSK